MIGRPKGSLDKGKNSHINRSEAHKGYNHPQWVKDKIRSKHKGRKHN